MNTKLIQKDIDVFINKKYKASITVEAALSFTITIFVLFAMLGPLLINYTASDILIELNNANKLMCNYELAKKNLNFDLNDGYASLADYVYLNAKLINSYNDDKSEYNNLFFINKTIGNIDDEYDEDTGVVKHDYEFWFHSPYDNLKPREIKLRLLSSRRAFIGADENRFTGLDSEGSDKYIYVSDSHVSSHIYHLYIDCTHLKKQTFPILSDELDNARNESGGKYYMCKHCFTGIEDEEYRSQSPPSTCYVTRYGEKYHYRENCELITAHVTKLEIDDIDKDLYRVCDTCNKRKNK